MTEKKMNEQNATIRAEIAELEATRPTPKDTEQKVVEIVDEFLNETYGTTNESYAEVYETKTLTPIQIIREKYYPNSTTPCKTKKFIWIKFTKDHYVGAVASTGSKRGDYNFCQPEEIIDRNDAIQKLVHQKTLKLNTSGILVKLVHKEWNEDLLILAPIYEEKIKNGQTWELKDLEHHIGEEIRAKFPIIDAASHRKDNKSQSQLQGIKDQLQNQ